MATTRQLLRNLTFANQLTFLRLIVIPFFAIALLNNRSELAFALFAGAAVTDVLDGLIARILKQKTALGALLDPAADKLLLTTALVFLSLPDHMKLAPEFELTNRIPLWLTCLAISRYLFIVLTAAVLYAVFAIRRFPPSLLGKLTTLFEILLVSLVLFCNALGRDSEFFVPLAIWTSLAFTLMSGFHYIYRTSLLVREADRAGAEGQPADRKDPAPIRSAAP